MARQALTPPPGSPTTTQESPRERPETTGLGYHRSPPHSIETEQSVLGAILTDPEAFSRVAWLYPEDFFRHDHQLIFRAIRELAERAPPDLVTVGDQLGDQLEEAGGTAYLAHMVNTTPTSANVEHYAQVVRDRARQRQAMELAEDLRARAAGADPAELQGLLDRHLQELEALEAEVAPQLEDPAALAVDDMLDHSPPVRRWLLDGFLPLDVVGVLAAGGGTGKSFMLLQMAVAVATGRPFLGIPIGEPGGVLVLAAEDDRAELHRRLRAIGDQLQADGEWGPQEEALVRQRLFIASRVGSDNRLVIEQNGRVVATGRHQEIARLVEDLPVEVNLLVLDPASRFRSGEENDNDAATRFVEVLEALRAETGATVLMAHHVSKDGLRADADRLGAEALRGASGLVDGVRWAAAMASMRPEAAKEFGVGEEEAGQYVRLDVVKANYGARWPGTWLRRQPAGVLTPASIQRNQPKPGPKPKDHYPGVLPRLLDVVKYHQDRAEGLSRRNVRDLYAGRSGELGANEKVVTEVIDRALEEGEIVEIPREKGAGKDLRLPGELVNGEAVKNSPTPNSSPGISHDDAG